ncbi:MAG: protein translocase subunit SecDF [Bacteroidetes bacterium]|nr:protein translocase subunit SecDF [Bacteroidota bacterium]
MQNKGAITTFGVLLGIICIYYLSFTWVTRGVEQDAEVFANEYISQPAVIEAAKAASNGDAMKQEDYLSNAMALKRDKYLDSLRKEVVFNIGVAKYTYDECKEKEINLGLDLRGGMNVTLEISVADILKGMSNNPEDIGLNDAIKVAQVKQRTDNRDFVVLFGEAYKAKNPSSRLAPLFQSIELKEKINFNSKDEEVLAILIERVQESILTAENTLRARIDKFGVTQPNIQRLQGSGRILVELPGVSDKERVRKLLQGTANLEFWETYDNKEIYPMLVEANKRIADFEKPATSSALDSLSVNADSTAKAAVAITDTAKAVQADTTKKSLADQLGTKDSNGTSALSDTSAAARMQRERPLFSLLNENIYQRDNQYVLADGPVVGLAKSKDTSKVNAYLNNPKIKSLFPSKLKLMWTVKASKRYKDDIFELVAIKISSRDGKAPLAGDIIADARKENDYNGSGYYQISMNMTTEAGKTWKRLTGDNIGKSIAVVLDNKVYSFPTVQSEIAGGRSQITGDFASKDADDLVNILKAGKLPAPARIVEETVVGPTLGKESISSGLLSFVIALGVVLLFMAFYYSKAGLVADIALFANVFLVMGVLASLGAVLTLPGIAGIVLTIGMSVDANILIFERVREEMAAGKGAGLSIKEGFSHAMSSILDSNVTTLLLGVILFVYGTGPVQGFATTLIIGILTSLFCAIFITRLIFDSMLNKNQTIAFSTPLTENAFKNTKIDFVGKRKLYYVFSGAFILLGAVFFFKNDGFNLGVDFKGGRSYVVRFDNKKTTDEVKEKLSESFGTSPEVKTYGESNQQKITTTYLIDDSSEDAETKVEAKLKEGLDKVGENYKILSSQKVGETISRDIKTKAIWSILFSCLVMFLYILIRFKKWQYGLGSVVALLHDVLIILSCYAIFDGVMPFSLELDQHFIAAILTVMGYSMNDTVVVFDRIREYLSNNKKNDLDKGERNTVINYALNSTLSRTVNTSLTIFFVLLTIFIFGGETIRGFSFALLIGIVIGTYSSICIATPVVIDFDRNKKE